MVLVISDMQREPYASTGVTLFKHEIMQVTTLEEAGVRVDSLVYVKSDLDAHAKFQERWISAVGKRKD